MTGTNEPDTGDGDHLDGRPPELGTAALKALAHPLRVRIFDILSTRGALTASKLGEIVSESSGSTSYHLRQLAKHGLVREVKGKGTARERWWERIPGAVSVSPLEHDSPAERAAAGAIGQEALRLRNERSLRFLGSTVPETHSEWLRTWRDGIAFATVDVWATPQQLAAIVEAWHAFAAEHLTPLTPQEGTPGTFPVEIHFDAFPLLDEHDEPL